MYNVVRKILTLYRGRIVGTISGLSFAFVYLHYGFLRTLFILLCATAGYYIGLRLDRDEDLRALLERLLPPVD
ncbi:MAG: hypothetical protein FD169_392 [Bacillota bacterium]|nr:MAG: hypothetical protein FD169_392 [Bacillota bacterium]MBS3951321.1 DUF2273 domain-containing protein [Peptococcaceae bacterium]